MQDFKEATKGGHVDLPSYVALKFTLNLIEFEFRKSHPDYTHGHNTLKLLYILVYVSLDTNKTELDIYQNKLYVQVVSREAKQLKLGSLEIWKY